MGGDGAVREGMGLWGNAAYDGPYGGAPFQEGNGETWSEGSGGASGFGIKRHPLVGP